MTTVVSVAQGGTGANSASSARSNLGAAPSAAYDQANNAYSAANTASSTGGGGYAQANAAYGQANAAYGQANNARSDANTTFATINTTFTTLNTSAATQNTNIGNAYDQANTARNTANNAYNNSNTKLSTSGGSISGDLAITGNLTVQGNATTINVSNLSVNDSMILLATGGVGDSNDIGFIGHIQRGATDTHVGLIRKATQNQFYLFDNYEVEPTNNVIDVSGNNFRVGNLRLGIINANSYVTSAGLDVTGQANAAYGQANTARSDANTTFATINTTFATINTTTATMNTATSNRVLKAGDTMTGNLTLSAASLVLSSTSNDQRLIDAEGTSATGRHVAFPLRFMIGSASAGYPFAGYNAIPRANGAYSYSTSDTAWGISYGNSSRMGFLYSASGTAGANISFSELMSITSGGSVGIGAVSPSSRLEVSGSTFNRITATATANVQSGIQIRRTGGVSDTDWEIYTPSGSTDLRIYNASDRITFSNTGNVGINTTSPTHKLDVNGTSIFRDTLNFGSGALISWTTGYGDGTTQTIQSPSSGSLALITNAATAMFIKSNQNIGIGTASPFSKLQVGSHTFSGGNGVYADSRAGITLHGSLTSIMYASTYNDSTYPDYGLVFVHGANTSNYNVWSLSPDGPAKGSSLNFIYGSNATNIHTGTPKVVFRGDGSVGIGTTNPTTKLHVVGDVRFGAGSTGGSNAGNLYIAGNRLWRWIAGYSPDYGVGNGFGLYDDTGGAYRISVNTSGSVGIGTVDARTVFQVGYSTYTGNGPGDIIRASSGGTTWIAADYSGQIAYFGSITDGTVKFAGYNYATGNNVDMILGQSSVYIKSSGNVGIGITSPAYKLHVQDATNTGNIAIGHATYPGLIYSSAGSGEFRIDNRASSSAGYITFYPNGQQNSIGNEAMRINTNGRVGIANTNPERTLHVEGISYNRGEIIRPTVYGGDNSGTSSTIGSYVLGAGKYWTVSSGAKYIHILLPSRYNSSTGASLMWCIEVKGYDFNAARIINLMIGGYVTPVSNGGPMSQIAAWDSAGSGVYSPTAYFSSNYSRGVARFYLSSSYYVSFTINTIASGNGDVIAPDELTIIESVNATI